MECGKYLIYILLSILFSSCSPSEPSIEEFIHGGNKKYWITNADDTLGESVRLLLLDKHHKTYNYVIARDNMLHEVYHDDIVINNYWKLINKDTLDLTGSVCLIEKINKDTLVILELDRGIREIYVAMPDSLVPSVR